MQRGRSAFRFALTLAELVVSTGATAILLGGMASAIILASRALPENGGALDGIVNAADVLDQISGELNGAVSVAESTATSIEFTVPDQNNDGSSEQIRYAWSGAPGDPLTREYNGGSAVEVLSSVYDMKMDYVLAPITVEVPGDPIKSGQLPVSWHTTCSDPKEWSVDRDRWIGQYIEPVDAAFSADSTTWELQRVRIMAQQDGTDTEKLVVQIREAGSGGKPTAVVLAERVVEESLLPTSWADFDIDFALADLDPGEGFCLVLGQSGGGRAAKIRFDDGSGRNRLSATDGGFSWNIDSGKSLYYVIYGEGSEPGDPQQVVKNYVAGARVLICAGEGDGDRVETSIHLLNLPEDGG